MRLPRPPGNMARATPAFLGGGPTLRGAVIAILAGGPTTISANIGKMGGGGIIAILAGAPTTRGGPLAPGGGGVGQFGDVFTPAQHKPFWRTWSGLNSTKNLRQVDRGHTSLGLQARQEGRKGQSWALRSSHRYKRKRKKIKRGGSKSYSQIMPHRPSRGLMSLCLQ